MAKRKRKNPIPFEPAWKQKWEQKLFDARRSTILMIFGTVVLIGFCILSFAITLPYRPIERKDALPVSVEFQSIRRILSRSPLQSYNLTTTEGKAYRLDQSYMDLDLRDYLSALPKGTRLDLLLDDGTILEITHSGREILNFDYAQKMFTLWICIQFLFGIAALVGSVFCIVYVSKKIFKEKIFARSKNVYQPPKPPQKRHLRKLAKKK